MEIVEMENIICKINSMNVLSSRMLMSEERFHQHEDREIEITHSDQQKKQAEKNPQSQDTWNKNRSNTGVIRVPPKKVECGLKKYSLKKMAENSLNLVKGINQQIQETE